MNPVRRFSNIGIVALLLMAALLIGSGGRPAAAAPSAPNGQVVLSEPNGNGDVTGEGNDYFTDKLADPDDMNNEEDILSPINWQGIPAQPTTGTWSGTTAAADSRVFLLHPGFANIAPGFHAHNGQSVPISTNAYTHLVIKYNSSTASNFRVFWLGPTSPFSQNEFGGGCAFPTVDGDNIIDVDLVACSSSAPTWTSRSTWAGIAIDPALNNSGTQIVIDWARLVPAAGGPTITAQWSCSACNGQTFDIYADNDNNEANGGQVKLRAGVSATSTSVDVPVGKLAPGNYFLAAKDEANPTSYSPGTFTVQAAPILKITAPSTTSGEDFASSVLGNPWNMDSAADVPATHNVTNFSVANGIAQGTGTNEDPQVDLLNGGNVIDTTKYKYLNFTLQMPRPGSALSNVARVLWSNNNGLIGDTKDIIYWHEFTNHFTFDLSNTPATDGSWTSSPSIFRIDPHELPIPPNFKLGPVTLTAVQRASQNTTVRIKWDVLRGSGTTTLFRETTANGSNGVQIATGVNIGDGGFDWNIGSTPAGTYYIRAVVGDSESTKTWYSEAPLIITAGGGNPTPTPTNVPGSFSDVHSTDFFFVPVQYLSTHGIISGYADGTFRPFNTTTRGQLAKIIVLGEQWALSNPGTATFRDVPVGSTFFQFVETAVDHGIISGYTDAAHCGSATPCFQPNSNVTRGQIAKIVVSAEGWTLSNPSTATFRDVPTSNTFFKFVETAVDHTIISGYNDAAHCGSATPCFQPGANATRGQIAKIVYGAITQP